MCHTLGSSRMITNRSMPLHRSPVSRFAWEGASRNFSLPYGQITLHAISKNPPSATTQQDDMATTPGAFAQPHMLVMVDGDRPWDSSSATTAEEAAAAALCSNNTNSAQMDVDDGTDEDEEDEDDNSSGRASDCPGSTSILRFVPREPNVLQKMYDALAECQALNPDSEDELNGSDELEGVPEEVDGEDEVDEGMNGELAWCVCV